MNNIFEVFRLAILAGISISIGCIVYLQVGGVPGAVLFALGLLTCVHFKLPLYTGTAGFVMDRTDLGRLAIILLGNIAGCFLMAWAMHISLPAVCEKAAVITDKRILYDIWQSCLLGIFCGFLMTVAVKFAREKSFLPLLFAVPVFILCGFIHSIADAFYIQAAAFNSFIAEWPKMLANYAFVVIGNFIGCNLYRILKWDLAYPKE